MSVHQQILVCQPNLGTQRATFCKALVSKDPVIISVTRVKKIQQMLQMYFEAQAEEMGFYLSLREWLLRLTGPKESDCAEAEPMVGPLVHAPCLD